MKCLSLFLLILGRVCAQDAGSTVISSGEVHFNEPTVPEPDGYGVILYYDKLVYTITRAPNGDKTFSFSVYHCQNPGSPLFDLNNLYSGNEYEAACILLPATTAETFSPVQTALGDFYNDASDAPHHVVYGQIPGNVNFGRPLPAVTVAQPAQSDPYTILYDGITNNIVNFDLKTFTITSQYTIPISTFISVFGVLSSNTGNSNQVWAASPQTGIYIVDADNGTLAGAIPTPSLSPSNTVPLSLVFSNDESTAFYAVSYYTPDASGNNGALLTFDVPSQTLTSTMPLKNAPFALVMAPDGLTLYILENGPQGGMLTYYDVLSGTADLTVSTATPGVSAGIQSSPVYIHPDGTRLFWNTNYVGYAFDLTTRKVVNTFNSGLPSTSAVSMQMTQDGAELWFINGLGSSVAVDTRYGIIEGTLQVPPQSGLYPGPSN